MVWPRTDPDGARRVEVGKNTDRRLGEDAGSAGTAFLQTVAQHQAGYRQDEAELYDFCAYAWAHYQWSKTGAVWYVDAILANQLLHTDPPGELPADYIAKLPFPGIYFALPPTYKLHEGGFLAGCYVTKDRSPVLMNETTIHTNVDAVTRFRAAYGGTVNTLLVVGCSTTREDDAITWMRFNICHNRSFADSFSYPDADGAGAALWNFVVNFLYAYRGGYLEVVEEKIPVENNKRLRKKMRREGAPPTRTVVRLGKKSIAYRKPSTGTGSPVAAHWVRGHWHGYWVAVPDADDHVERTKEENGRSYSFVLRWIEPYPKGLGTPAAPEYRVVEGRT